MVLRNGSNLSSDWSEINGTGTADDGTSQAIRVDELDHFDEAWVKPFPLRDGVRIRKGERFSDYYTLFEEIGEGKFGKVYRCVEKATDLMLAAKCIKIRKDTDFEKVEKEVNIMTQMRHKCIAQIYDAFATTDNDVILIMEIVQGGELFDRVADDSYILTEMAVALIMFQICEAIRYIHSQNIIHLDLKPENIMCVSQTSNQIKLIDFGLAQWYDGSKDLMFMAGTPEFAAPEVIKYEPLDFHTDMWSLGVIAYILLSGQSPFLGETLAHTYCNVERGNWMFCEEFAENGISSDAKDFISKLLILKKERRMLPDECLRHAWIRKNRERALAASRTASPAVCHPLAVDKFRKYVKNKRFRRLVFGVLFINQVMRMMQTMQRNKSVHGAEYVRNLLVAAEQRQTNANNNNGTTTTIENGHGNSIGDSDSIGTTISGGGSANESAKGKVSKQQRRQEGQKMEEMAMDTSNNDSNNDNDHHHPQQKKKVVIAVTPPGDSGGDAKKAVATTAASAKKKVVVVKRVPRGEKRSKSEARRAADQQRTRSSTEQTSNKKQRQESGGAGGGEQCQQHQRVAADSDCSSAKSPLTARRLGQRETAEASGGGTSDNSSSSKSPLMARRSVKFEEVPTVATTTTATAASEAPKAAAASATGSPIMKRVSGGDSKVLRIAARLAEQNAGGGECSPSTSASTNGGAGKRLSAEAATITKKKSLSSSSNVSALLKKLEQKGAGAAAAASSATTTPTSSRWSSCSASPLSLAVTAIAPKTATLKKAEERASDHGEKQQQKVIKVVKKKKRVLRVRTVDDQPQQQQTTEQRLGEAAATVTAARAPSASEEKPGMKPKQQLRRQDKVAQEVIVNEEKPVKKLNVPGPWGNMALAAQNGHRLAAGVKPKEKQQLNGGELTENRFKPPLATGLLSPRAKQRLKLANSVPLTNNGRKAGGAESTDAMDEGWDVVGQDVFDFSLLRKKLQNRIMGLKDKEDLETEAENQQRFELQKQQNMLRTNLNIKRAMRKWISMDRETKQHQNGNGTTTLPDWAM
ncbi:hypothetical protein niasHT_031055 [Heterodera trifolii]|uniref:Protein kinase domain-containing protein n=1 Tax=Heterodera trifolii TaxID=157864 RepID=A0ABD2HU57_9BILA